MPLPSFVSWLTSVVFRGVSFLFADHRPPAILQYGPAAGGEVKVKSRSGVRPTSAHETGVAVKECNCARCFATTNEVGNYAHDGTNGCSGREALTLLVLVWTALVGGRRI